MLAIVKLALDDCHTVVCTTGGCIKATRPDIYMLILVLL